MKHKLLYLFPLLIACTAGCSKKPAVVDYQLTVPTGNFTGLFTRYHLTVATGKIDTLYANILLNLDASGNFAVTGDTSIHAGSFGKYSLGTGDDLLFTDKTLPATGTPVKPHLSGDYLFTYGSGILNLQKDVGDSLSYQYSFTKN
jgi:hypothetical protein